MSKYPYIGKGCLSEAILLFIATGEALVLHQGRSKYAQYVKGVEESLFRNITPEHLENTCIEYKSEGHKHFIRNIVTVNGLHYFVRDSFIYVTAQKDGNTYNARQITIPLPPNKNKNLVDINDFQCSGCNVPICPVCIKQDELPKVGDDVQIGFESIVIGGKLLALTKEYAILSQGDREQHFHLGSWSFLKQKTPEQELYDKIENNIYEKLKERGFVEAELSLDEISFEIASSLMSEYNITKKVKDND